VSTTYAVIAASSELSSPEECGRVLWVWQDDGSLKAKDKQKSKIVVRDISIEPCEYKSDFATVSFHLNKLHMHSFHRLNFLVVL
jgi:hypothetical protein